MNISRPALRYHGGKFRMAPFILNFFPEHKCYVEPFGGAAAVLLQKNPCYAEVYNDLDSDIVNFFRVLRDPDLSQQLALLCRLTPYARDEFNLSYEATEDPLEKARRTVIRAQMGFGSAGTTKGTTGFRIDTRRIYSTAMHNWRDWPDVISAISERLRGVLIENRPAIDVIQQHDAFDTLHYVDPPYIFSTRTAGSNRFYRYEMTDSDHEDLLRVLLELDGFVVASGYDSDLYHDTLAGWEVFRTNSRISAGRGTAVRTEVVWINQACSAALNRGQADLFRGAACG